jgi:hypothetical protein
MARTTQQIERVKDRALELGVYLPLGALVTVKDEIADVDTPNFRRLYSTFVDRGQDRLEPIERVIRRRANKAERRIEKTAGEVTKSAKRTATKTAKRASAASNEIAPKLPRVAAPRSARDLAIAGYDSLTAGEIVSQLRGLTQTEVAKVYKYERANDNRSTILEAAESKFTDLPIATFDALTVDEISGRLEKLSKSELKVLRRYEAETKQRQTVLDRIDSLL